MFLDKFFSVAGTIFLPAVTYKGSGAHSDSLPVGTGDSLPVSKSPSGYK